MCSSVRWYFNSGKWNPNRSDLLLASSCIQSEEKERLGRFYFQKDFKPSLIGRLMMRKYVSESCQNDYRSVLFNRDDKGKPFLANFSTPVAFNVSHHGNYVVFVGELDNSLVGVDVMKLEYSGGKTLPEFFRIMKRNFSDMEWSTIYSCAGDKDKIEMFCRLWCLKESYVKAIGVGITLKLNDLSFNIATKQLTKDCLVKDTKLYIKGERQSEWYFEETLIDDEHCVAIGSNKKISGPAFQEISFGELVRNAVPLLPEDSLFCDSVLAKPERP
ncbi:L-aminoadipate-semialdehyde dehydrogenase-phosphopantetheinyl transferase [Cylas formicarius]|uniref:L-aminoadipate-semialdehyde dehydrogenase-phosphopantetheinyl transferase n=1 Tax=Cylas formicarius TaxID=197179 RepID=UPI002958DB3A|nr:L-aminoadipate-semialdehyde dehydrogenase-phosphopantetheinyl transferase [Cylas formicarius]